MKKLVLILFVFSVCISNSVFSQKENNGNKANLDACGLPSNPNIIAGDCINFTDCSSGAPTYWKWTFEGAEPEISYSQHPQGICYYTQGVFSFVLEVQNSTGIDTEVYSGAINVGANTTTPIAYFKANTTTIPIGGSVTFTNLSQNGPFTDIKWDFQGAVNNYYNFDPPVPITYNTIGDFNVQLRVQDGNGNVSTLKKQKYIHVVPLATNPPVADFAADRTFIAPGDVVNFADLSKNNPYQWKWIFEGNPTLPYPDIIYSKNPSGIKYQTQGTYKVTLISTNSIGSDTLIKTMYIRVAATDPCLTNPNIPAPIADFEGSPRLIPVGSKVYFQDRSENYPTLWNWNFPGGSPTNSVASNQINGVAYNSTNYSPYDVWLSVNDACLRTSSILKEKYIMVFSGPMTEYCDTISNINRLEETLGCPGIQGATWGYASGFNSFKTIGYAEKFAQYQFDFVNELVLSVAKSKKIDNTNYVTFYVWDGSTEYPEIVLGEKKVFLKDLPANFWNSVTFDTPVRVDGPFFIGYTLKYSKGTNTAENNPQFAVSLVNRGNNAGLNTFYIQGQDSLWLSTHTRYGYAASSSLAPRSCVIDVEDFGIKNNISIYPNPADEKVFVNTGDLEYGKDLYISIYDMMGRLVYEDKTVINGQEIMINTSSFNSGLYMVSLLINKNRVSQKLLINK